MGVLAESLKRGLHCVLLLKKSSFLTSMQMNRLRTKRVAGVGSTTFNLAMNSPLPSREAVIKNKHNKRGLSRLL